jgi:cytochrome c oxidase subunit III
MGLFKTLGTKPWLETDVPDGGYGGGGASRAPTARIGLIGFMGVVTAMFSLFTVAYRMRMGMSSDWLALQEPTILWVNTGLLVLASGALQWAWMCARDGKMAAAKNTLTLAGIMTFGFLIGQFLAWQEMVANGFFAQTNPSYAFFYLLTGLHGLHIAGGLVAWARATLRLFAPRAQTMVSPVDEDQRRGAIQLSLELCALYWHFLLAVWVLLFALMLSN